MGKPPGAINFGCTLSNQWGVLGFITKELDWSLVTPELVSWSWHNLAFLEGDSEIFLCSNWVSVPEILFSILFCSENLFLTYLLFFCFWHVIWLLHAQNWQSWYACCPEHNCFWSYAPPMGERQSCNLGPCLWAFHNSYPQYNAQWSCQTQTLSKLCETSHKFIVWKILLITGFLSRLEYLLVGLDLRIFKN